MSLNEWRNLADMGRTVWLRASAWCALNLSMASTRGVTVMLWTMAATFLLEHLPFHGAAMPGPGVTAPDLPHRP